MNDQDVRQLGEQLQQSLSALCAAHSVELRSFTATPVRLTDGGLTLFAVAVLNQQPMVPVAAMRAIRRLIGTSGQVNDS